MKINYEQVKVGDVLLLGAKSHELESISCYGIVLPTGRIAVVTHFEDQGELESQAGKPGDCFIRHGIPQSGAACAGFFRYSAGLFHVQGRAARPSPRP